MSIEYRQLSVHHESPAIWRVTINHPPINMVDFETLRELHQLTSDIDDSKDLKVVVFESADPDFFLAHWDMASAAPTDAPPPPSWIEISQRITQSSVVSIALIRGRVRGIGSEIALACDMRFASTERAIFGQPEVGVGVVPGGGAMQRLPLLVGRARAMEIVLGADDFDAPSAERYGWINRALPDSELDGFVAGLARRMASFERPALAEAKRMLNHYGLPSPDDLNDSQTLFRQAVTWPGTKVRAKKLMEQGMGTRGDLEMHFGEHLPALAQG